MVTATPAGADTLSFTEVDAFPPLDDIEPGQLFALSLSTPTTAGTHGLHRFAAKFVPQVPGWALDAFGGPADRLVVDPFMGSGTTLVEGLLRGGTTVGVDVDPLARFIARAKVTAVDPDRLRTLAAALADRWRAPARTLQAPMPDVENFGHWFAPRQWAWLQSLRDAILALDCHDDERAFLLVVFSSILRWVSNADDQSQKTYVSGTHRKHPPPVETVFRRFLGRAVGGLADLRQRRAADAVVRIADAGADATALRLPAGSVDLAVTSPPYLDSVDYPYNMMLEYFWLGPLLGVPDRRAFNALRRRPVGAKNPTEARGLPPALARLVALDALPPARRPAAATYFALMERHFAEMARVLKPGARYVFVVGNSQSRRDMVPLHDALVRLGAGAGLGLERAFGYRIRRHYMKFPRAGRGGIILIDWVLVFRRQPATTTPALLPRHWLTLAPGAVAH